ncbi:MAG: large conductance mechanosensitive channel protein MscL [Parvibaculum sp.]|jgi:large conductance mechanosensitive channel|uniref:large conductance mechanosensitive channel protein MscL n=1 Tax=Parvibaculum sp. TaxID=2024848 RepID=UPI00283D112A|nr:large conductance mechanosensitive channel protein MscL [Parvibaculum sp.]MDR3497943.1 large conductance mechanosensitive channel protein MscL [Parvibaculum sp.]
MFKEFREFALKGNVLDMAVGIIIGAAFTSIVTSLVSDILMPPIGVIMGGVDFSSYFIPLSMHAAPTTLEAAKAAGVPVLAYGKFVNACINFTIVAFALFIVIRQMNRLKDRIAKGEVPAAEKPRQEVLLEEIRDALKARG